MSENPGGIIESQPRLRYSENTAAAHLEQSLGIKFVDPPKQVVLNFRNRIGLFRVIGIEALVTGSSDQAGNYSLEHNLLIVKPRMPDFVKLHENTHALMAQVNPMWGKISNDILPHSGIDIFRGKLKPEDPDLEDVVVKSCVMEGFCDWAALFTTKKLSQHYSLDTGENFISASTMHHYREPGHTDETYEQYSERMYDKLGGQIEELKDAVTKRQGMRVVNLKFKIKDLQIATGFWFVSDTMSRLLTGRSVNQAVELLLNNPPSTLTELKSPSDYAKRLLRQASR